MRRLIGVMIAFVLAIGGLYALRERAESEPESARGEAGLLKEMELGAPDAPVEMIEYASMTCGHCAAFHTASFPRLEKDYIEAGKLRYVFREFPLDSWALAGSLLARCAEKRGGETRFFAFLKVLFEHQDKWVLSEDRAAGLRRIARQGGMGEEAFEACLKDEDLLEGLRKRRERASDVMGVKSTPTFFINGERLEGNQPYSEIRAIIDREIRRSGG